MSLYLRKGRLLQVFTQNARGNIGRYILSGLFMMLPEQIIWFYKIAERAARMREGTHT